MFLVVETSNEMGSCSHMRTLEHGNLPLQSCFKSATLKEIKIFMYFNHVINFNLFYLIYCVIEIFKLWCK